MHEIMQECNDICVAQVFKPDIRMYLQDMVDGGLASSSCAVASSEQVVATPTGIPALPLVKKQRLPKGSPKGLETPALLVAACASEAAG